MRPHHSFRLLDSLPKGSYLLSDISFLDQRIGVLSDRGDRIPQYFALTHSHDLEVLYADIPVTMRGYYPENKTLVYPTKRYSMHELRQLLSCGLDFQSSRYSAMHACGLVSEGRGMVFTGNRGAGKSTMRTFFPKATVLDDDVIIIDRNAMYVTGTCGAVTDLHDHMRLHYQRSGPLESRIHAVFLLDKTMPGGYLSQCDNIPRTFSVFDALAPWMQQEYLSHNAIHVDVPVFRIGTDGSPEQTCDRIINASHT
jgi:hypothetical protein